MKFIVIAALLISILDESHAVSKCPDVKFVDNFDYNRFLGRWYGIQTIGIDMPCGSYELFETGIPNKYRMVVQPANYMVELTQKGPLSEGFTSSSAIPLLHNANMRVPFTDYDNYAVVVECKNLDGPIYLSVSIGSRTRTLDNSIIEKLKNEITSTYGIDLSAIKAIDQKSCI